MIALDTNVLVRYLVGDDAKQSAEAAALIDAAVENGEEIFIPQIVLCELVWVLSYAYELSRSEIVAALRELQRAAQIVVEGPDQVRRATDGYEESRGDFADYLLAERAIANGCRLIATFDHNLYRDSRFKKPSAAR